MQAKSVTRKPTFQQLSKTIDIMVWIVFWIYMCYSSHGPRWLALSASLVLSLIPLYSIRKLWEKDPPDERAEYIACMSGYLTKQVVALTVVVLAVTATLQGKSIPSSLILIAVVVAFSDACFRHYFGLSEEENKATVGKLKLPVSWPFIISMAVALTLVILIWIQLSSLVNFVNMQK